jgi:phage terminase small subunit
MSRQTKRSKRVAPPAPKPKGRRGGKRRRKTADVTARVCNDREIIFIDEYLKDFNGTQAAIRAGFTDKATSAKSIASRMLNEPHVLLELARRREQLMDKIALSRDLILEEIRRIAFSNMGRVASWDETTVSLIPKDCLSPEDVAGIMQIEGHEEETVKEIKQRKSRPKKGATAKEIEAARAAEPDKEEWLINRKKHAKIRLHPKLPALQDLLERIDPSEAEKRRGLTGSGGVQLIIDGGPTGLEVPTGPTVTVRVGAKQTAAA